jgi:hypothetical protein
MHRLIRSKSNSGNGGNVRSSDELPLPLSSRDRLNGRNPRPLDWTRSGRLTRSSRPIIRTQERQKERRPKQPNQPRAKSRKLFHSALHGSKLDPKPKRSLASCLRALREDPRLIDRAERAAPRQNRQPATPAGAGAFHQIRVSLVDACDRGHGLERSNRTGMRRSRRRLVASFAIATSVR